MSQFFTVCEQIHVKRESDTVNHYKSGLFSFCVAALNTPFGQSCCYISFGSNIFSVCLHGIKVFFHLKPPFRVDFNDFGIPQNIKIGPLKRVDFHTELQEFQITSNLFPTHTSILVNISKGRHCCEGLRTTLSSNYALAETWDLWKLHSQIQNSHFLEIFIIL